MVELKRLVLGHAEDGEEGEKEGGSQPRTAKPLPVLGTLDEGTIETMLAPFLDPFYEHIKDYRNK